jgi:pyrroline-5-carboxylate reductase
MNAVTGLSGSGPAFVYLFIEAMADAGVLAGLPRAQALRLAAGTVEGAAAMVLQSGEHPGVLKDKVCSPAGTTIAGVQALEKGALRATVMQAVESAWRRAESLQS